MPNLFNFIFMPKRVERENFSLRVQRILRIKFDDYWIHLDFFHLFICTSSYTLCLHHWNDQEKSKKKKCFVSTRSECMCKLENENNTRFLWLLLRRRRRLHFHWLLEFWVNTRKMENSKRLNLRYCVLFDLLALT